MKKLIFLLLIAIGFTACSKSDVFYTSVYPILRVGAVVEIESKEGSDALTDQIFEEVIATSPVKAGDRYICDFSLYNGGSVTLTHAEGETQLGTFVKEPASKKISFTFGEQTTTFDVAYYQEEGVEGRRTKFVEDLTGVYQDLYPEKGIIRIVREMMTEAKFTK